MKKNKKVVYSIIGFISFSLMILFGILYFVNLFGNKLFVGKMVIKNKLNNISFSNTNSVDNQDDTQTITISFKGKTSDKKIEYLIELVDGSFDVNELSISLSFDVKGLGKEDKLYFTNREKNSSIYKILYDEESFNSEQLMVGIIPENTSNVSGEVIIKATLKDETKNNNLSFKINVEAKEGFWINEPAYQVIEKRSNEKSNCESIKKVLNTSKFGGEGDIIYFTGSEECINDNYVWYSGKLWRIVALYPNGIMKLVTENPMTVIDFGEDFLFNESYANNWLLQEFLPTLSNYEKIVVFNAIWDISFYDASSENKMIIRRPIGLLNSYEYEMSITNDNSYLNIGQYWWLSDSYDQKYVRGISDEGKVISSLSLLSSLAVRPSIYLKASVSFSNSSELDVGKRNNPYRIIGDKKVGEKGELVSNRQIGEFVVINNQVYRIVGFEEKESSIITKLVLTEYVENTNSSNGNKFLASFGEDTSFKTDSNSEQYWDNYLKNNWLKDNNMQDVGTYYLGSYHSGNYLQTLCKNDVDDIDNCIKIDDNELLYQGMVGLLRVGEMFSAQQSFKEHITSSDKYLPMWLITPYKEGTTSVRKINNNGVLGSTSIHGNFNAVRPTIYLKANIKIASGEGTITNPYQLTI